MNFCLFCCMIVVLEQDPEQRLSLHQQWQNNLPADNLVTVADATELLHLLASLRPAALCIGSENQSVVPTIRNMPAGQEVPIIVLAFSSLQIDRTLAKQYNTHFILKPLRPYQLQEITDRYLPVPSQK